MIALTATPKPYKINICSDLKFQPSSVSIIACFRHPSDIFMSYFNPPPTQILDWWRKNTHQDINAISPNQMPSYNQKKAYFILFLIIFSI